MKKGTIIKLVIALFFVVSGIGAAVNAAKSGETFGNTVGPLMVGLVIAAALVAWALLPLRKRSAGMQAAAQVQQGSSEKYRFAVAGLFYREEALFSVAQRHKDFGIADADFIQKHGSGRAVYEWNLKRSSKVELVPEPTNEHDPNAIAVYVDGAHVGYVPASETGEVRQLLAVPCSVRGWIAGGARKKVVNGRVVTEATDLNMYVEIEREA